MSLVGAGRGAITKGLAIGSRVSHVMGLGVCEFSLFGGFGGSAPGWWVDMWVYVCGWVVGSFGFQRRGVSRAPVSCSRSTRGYAIRTWGGAVGPFRGGGGTIFLT
jgi:hypothetical protein